MFDYNLLTTNHWVENSLMILTLLLAHTLQYFDIALMARYPYMITPIEIENAFTQYATAALKDQGDGIAQRRKFSLGIRRSGCVEDIDVGRW